MTETLHEQAAAGVREAAGRLVAEMRDWPTCALTRGGEAVIAWYVKDGRLVVTVTVTRAVLG